MGGKLISKRVVNLTFDSSTRLRAPWRDRIAGNGILGCFSGVRNECCTIYDIGKHGEQSFIAMELDCLTLKHRVAGRPLETEIVLSLASRSPMRSTQPVQKPLFLVRSSPNILVTKRGHAKPVPKDGGSEKPRPPGL